MDRHGQILSSTAESSRTVPAHIRNYGLTSSPVSALPPDSRVFPGDGHHDQQGVLQPTLVPMPTRQLSTTSQTMDRLSQLRLSPQSARNKPNETHGRNGTTVPKKLPEPWGAQSFLVTPEQIDVDLLRAASYGDLTEIRRLHLRGINVLATGTFDNGEPKSALFSAAEAIETCFEDIQKLHAPFGSDRERLWKEINSKAEVVQYLMYHGARLDVLDPTLRDYVYRALQGQPEAGLAVPHSQQSQGGFRPIAAASADVRLPPIVTGPPAEKQRRISLSTAAISRAKADTIEAKDSQSSLKARELAVLGMKYNSKDE